MDGDIQDCIDHLIVAEKRGTLERKRTLENEELIVENDFLEIVNINCIIVMMISNNYLKHKRKIFLLCRLDTDIKKIPEHLLKEEDPICIQQSHH